ncbi:MAG TPA: hypothetical protein VFA13_07755 [Candidatus Acidoferrum sp.]|nr:hypothetical protein [Candidatus Acidoferrum sp.]
MPIKPTPLETKGRKGVQIRNDSPAPLLLLEKVPPAPAGFKKRREKLDLWKKTCEDMIAMRLLTTNSLVAVEIYVRSVFFMREVMDDKAAKYPQRVAALNAVRVAAAELGLTPSSHAKVKTPPEAVPDNERERIAAELIQ